MPQVSIITPTYNCAEFIVQTIESVLAQSYADWEMIISDDCSTDNTLEVIKPYLESDLNPTRKWSYKTNSPLFKVGFERVAEMMPIILEAEDTFLCTDVGMIDFTVTYEDKSKKHNRYWCTNDAFKECFMAINDLVPQTEMRPEVTHLYSEDIEEE